VVAGGNDEKTCHAGDEAIQIFTGARLDRFVLLAMMNDGASPRFRQPEDLISSAKKLAGIK
jgi:hypothetical protein